ncbi:MAG: SulP family sulfate permease, partial [Myxococcota bacterium]
MFVVSPGVTVSSLIPLIAQSRDLSRAGLRDELVAGLTTGIMLVPQAMAYAMLAGLPPIVGLYASTVPLVLYALMGTSRQLAVGPVAMVSLMTAAAVAPIAQGDAALALGLSVTLAAVVGVLQLGMGLARLGALVRFLSHPVIAGFTSAAALIIGASQLGHLLGVSVPRSHYVHETIAHVVRALPDTNPAAAGIGLGAVVMLVLLKRVAPRFPRHLLVVAGATLVVALGGFTDRVAVVGAVPAGLPSIGLPSVSGVGELLPMALAIALVSFMESISVAKHFARRNGYELDPD